MLQHSVLWAKKPQLHDDMTWLSLQGHMADSAETALLVWENFVPRIIQNQIIKGIITEPYEEFEIAKRVLMFLACAHDLGKATPIFQNKKAFNAPRTDGQIRRSIMNAGFILDDNYTNPEKTWHAVVSHAILAKYNFDESVAVVLGGHHGIPPTTGQIEELGEGICDHSCGFDSDAWLGAQYELLKYVLDISGLSMKRAKNLKLTRPAQALLSGLVILNDWIASDTNLFPLVQLEKFSVDSKKRAAEALIKLRLPAAWNFEQYDWDSLYDCRFGIKMPRPVQSALLEVAKNAYAPGIFVVEAPMGEGKTEAALAAAEILAKEMGCRGVYFALPSQATSNAMFERVLDWIKNFDKFERSDKYSVRLTHGRAEFNENYNVLKFSGDVITYSENDENAVIVHEWFSGRKKGVFADFAVGTIDHVLMAGLKQKHLALRHLGFAGKVIIIDECHAYDVYMESYLLKALNWLGAYGVPVIILSATLPRSRRKAVVEAYLNKRESHPLRQTPRAESVADEKWAESLTYPLITYTDGAEVKTIAVESQTENRGKTIYINRCCDENLMDELEINIENGGCAGIIVNTVRRAQELYALVAERFGTDDIRLLHSGFLGVDRNSKEKDLLSLLGSPDKARRPNRLIVIGTQIFEQSMDIDFDVMFSDLCPIDLLLQRIGRLHRHERARPRGLEQAVCYVMGTEWRKFDAGSEAVYGRYILMRSRAILPESITLPQDIPELVAHVYDQESELALPDDVLGDYAIAQKEYESEKEERVRRSEAFQISRPTLKRSLVSWLDMGIRDDSEKRGEAAVRDGADSIEVIIIRRTDSGGLALLPWIGGGRVLPRTEPDEELAKIIAGCYVRLPARLSKKWIIDKIIDALESIMRDEEIVENWYKSPWLKGVLCLILDENLQTDLCGFSVVYDEHLGLRVEKSDEEG